MADTKFKLDKALVPILNQLARQVGCYLRLHGHNAVLEQWDAQVNGTKHTFIRICQRAPVYRCKSLGIIVKRPNFIMTPTTPLAVRIPTIKLDVKDWVVQPIAVKRNTNTAVSLIKKQLGDFYCDLHYLNVGWWNDKPYMFDW